MVSSEERRGIARKAREQVIDDVSFTGCVAADVIGADYYHDEECWRRLADLIDPGEDVSMSAYDLLSDEDREAIRWVREHGGLSDVRLVHNAADNRRVELCSALGIDLETGWSDAMACIGTRLMPEGMEWPRFDDGEPVRIGDEVICDGRCSPCEVNSIEFCHDMIKLYDCQGLLIAGARLSYGERVKRPAPAVLAADGKPLNKGDRVWDVRGNRRFEVLEIDDEGKLGEYVVKTRGADGIGLTGWSRPCDLTHHRPVIGADGKPLNVGDVVWDTYRDEKMTVAEITMNGLVYADYEDETGALRQTLLTDASERLTHERPDSWEYLESDAELRPMAYCHDRGLECGESPDPDDATYVEAMVEDIVRRARALAEKGQWWHASGPEDVLGLPG